MNTERIKPVIPPYSESLRKSFATVMPEGVPPLNIFRAVGNNQRVLERMVKGGLLDKGSITLAQRELVILRASANCKAEYEWGVHVAAFARKAEFSKEQIAATCDSGASSELWSNEQLAVIHMVDELHQSAPCRTRTGLS